MRGAEMRAARQPPSVRFMISCALQFMMRRPPLAPREAKGRPSRERTTGAMLRERRLAAGDRVRPARLRIEPHHAVVEQHAGSGHGHPAPPQGEQRLGAGDGHAVAIDHAEVGRGAVRHLARGGTGDVIGDRGRRDRARCRCARRSRPGSAQAVLRAAPHALLGVSGW